MKKRQESYDEPSVASEVVAAALGGAISSAALYPLEVIKTQMQAVDDAVAAAQERKRDNEQEPHPSAPHGMMDFAIDLYQTQGISVFYRGLECSVLQSALEKGLYFFFYTTFQRAHRKLQPRDVSQTSITNLILGYVSEWAHLPISLPFDAWTTAIQTSHRRQAPLQIFLAMLGDKNQRFYKGISAYYLLCFKPALQYAVYEQLKALWLQKTKRKSLSAREAFGFGLVARTVATVMIFPFLRAKVLVQTQPRGTCQVLDPTNKTTASVLWRQWKLEGLPGLYRGLAPELTRGALSAAIMLAIKERLAEYIQYLIR